MSTVVACPACQQNLAVPAEMVGQTVRCPSCAGTFVAAVDAVQARVPPPMPADHVPDWEKPLPDEEFAAPLDEGEGRADDDRPRRKRKKKPGGGYYDELLRQQRKRQAPHRGGLVLTMGILSVVFFWACVLGIGAFICGGYAYRWGSYDLREMEAGRMDPTGKTVTYVGWILGICGMFLSVAAMGCCLVSSVYNLLPAMIGH